MRTRNLVAVLAAGLLIFVALLLFAVAGPPLGSAEYLLLSAIAGSGYVVALAAILTSRTEPSVTFTAACLLLAVGMRVPLWITPPGDDVCRYVWDARVQAEGYNPYVVVPSDPRLATLHTDETRRINHPELPTPYPPGAQLFFRVAYLFGTTGRVFKVAIGVCDVLLALVLWHWLKALGAPRGWVLAYAWNPLVILVTASEGHVDAVGALCLTASALFLVRKRRLTSVLCFTLATAIKPMPIVLLPLFWRRVRLEHALAGVAFALVLAAPYLRDGIAPVGSVGTFIHEFRFNYTLFYVTNALLGARGATAFAIAAGITVAALLQARYGITRAGTWGWPMAVSLVGAPVVYPWYLVWLVPFAISIGTLPLLAWSMSISSTYVVWHLASVGRPWSVPARVLAFEFGTVAAVGLAVLAVRGAGETREGASNELAG